MTPFRADYEKKYTIPRSRLIPLTTGSNAQHLVRIAGIKEAGLPFDMTRGSFFQLQDFRLVLGQAITDYTV